MAKSLRAARAAIAQGRSPKAFLDNVNALVCGKGTYIYVADGGLICCNTRPRMRTVGPARVAEVPLPESVLFEVDRVVMYFPDGRVKVIKDHTESAS